MGAPAVGWGFRIRWAVLPSGERVPLLTWRGEFGVPDESVARYVLTNLRARKVPNSIELDLRGIGMGLAFCAARDIDLMERIARGAFLDSNELMALHEFMRRGKRVSIVQVDVAADRYHAFIHYVIWCAEPILKRISKRSALQIARGELADFKKKAFAVGPKKSRDAATGNPGARLGMTAEQRALFLRVIVPGAPENPFREDLQLRNHAYLLLCYHLGARAGEMLGLKVKDIDRTQRPVVVSIKRRHDDPEDPRKRPAATKTRERDLAIDEEVASVLDKWMKNRSKKEAFPRARKWPYIFVNEDGDPITQHGLSGIYQTLRKKHPSLPKDLATHIVRHDRNDRWVENPDDAGDASAHEADQIYLMGWSDRSKMPSRYGARARQNRANKKSLELQRRDLGKADK